MSPDYISQVNTIVAGTINPHASFEGSYDDTSGYQLVRLWVSAPGALQVYIHYADDNAGLNEIEEVFSVYPNHASSLTSLIKKRYSYTSVYNGTPDISVNNFKVITKYVSRLAHPVISYMSDDVVANVTVALDDITLNSIIDHSGQSILVYGATERDALRDHRVILTDDNGCVRVTGAPLDGSICPVTVGGILPNGNVAALSLDSCGAIVTRSLHANTDTVTVCGAVLALDRVGNPVSFLTDAGGVNIRPLNSTFDVVATVPYGGTPTQVYGPTVAGQPVTGNLLPVLVGGIDNNNKLQCFPLDSQHRLLTNVSGSVQLVDQNGRGVNLVNTDGDLAVRQLTFLDEITVLGSAPVGEIPTDNPLIIAGLDADGRVQSVVLNDNGAITIATQPTSALLMGALGAGGTTQALQVATDGLLQVTVSGASFATVRGPDTVGATATGAPVQVSGRDGTGKVRALAIDDNGNLKVTPSVTQMTIQGTQAAGVANTVAPIIIGGVDDGGLSRCIKTDTTGVTYVRAPTNTSFMIEGTQLDGASSSACPIVIGGVDGTGHLRGLQTDSLGRLQTVVYATGATNTTGLNCDGTSVSISNSAVTVTAVHLCNSGPTLAFVHLTDGVKDINLPVLPSSSDHIQLTAVLFQSLQVSCTNKLDRVETSTVTNQTELVYCTIVMTG